jgi:methylated-DNA-[protein]-cysteine S-methyltransferase
MLAQLCAPRARTGLKTGIRAMIFVIDGWKGMRQIMQQFHVFETASGFCGIAWNDAGITRFRLADKTADAAARGLLRRLPDAEPGPPPPEIENVITAAKRYFAGEKIDFSDAVLDLGEQDELFTRIYDAARRVGYGETTTYGTLAKQLGGDWEMAREVGQAMAKNPVPLIIPCHRVLAAGGKVGGFSAPGGAESKKRMLELEGVHLGAKESAQKSLGF